MLFFETCVVWIMLARAPQRCEQGDNVHVLDSYARESISVVSSLSPQPDVLSGSDWQTAMAGDFSCVPEVQHVLIERAEDTFLVWVTLDNPERSVRERIFQKELSMIEGFPEVNFDFNIIPSNGSRPDDVVSGAKVVYSRVG